MSYTGGTTGDPIVGGIGTGLSIANELQATWLSLPRYARIVGVIAPPHFFGSYSGIAFPLAGTCDAIVPRHGWQFGEVISREEILESMYIAEMEIAEYLGYNLAPTFVDNETHRYPKPYDPLYVGSGGVGTNSMEKSIQPRMGGFMLQPGPRGTTLVGTATTVGGGLTYTDEDGDGLAETVTVTMATTVTNPCELKVYITDTEGDPAWEIRGPNKKYLDGGNVVFKFNIWHFIDPDVDAKYPNGGWRALDLAVAGNLLDSVDIYREYVDNTQASARFFWESSAGCATAGVTDVGSLTYQDGVAIIRDVQSGLLVPRTASYNSGLGIWTGDTWTVGRDPDIVRVSYYAGDVSKAYLSGRSCDPLKDIYAKAIAYMATARLTRSICSCPGVVVFFDSLQQDLAHSTTGDTFSLGFRDMENPFGTRRGELMAWRLVGKLRKERAIEVAVI